MAKLSGDIQFTGTLGEVIAYRMKNSDKIILRRKAGPDRAAIKKHKNYAATRLNNEEFKGVVEARKQLSYLLYPLRHLADLSATGRLNGLCKSIQKDDMLHPLGQRHVLVSQHGYKLEGFSLNSKQPFEILVKHPLQYEIEKAGGSARVWLPAMVPGVNLYNPGSRPLYRLSFVLGAVADIIFNPEKKRYVRNQEKQVFPAIASTDWYTWKETMPAQELLLQLAAAPQPAAYSLLLAGGIEFGMPLPGSTIVPVKGEGAARLLCCR